MSAGKEGMAGARATAVIVSYRSEKTIGEAMASARRCHEAGVMRTIVVDNASDDGTREALRREGSWARLVLNERNEGFGRGANAGLALVDTPYTVVMNADVALEPEAAGELVRFMDATPRAGLAGPATRCGGGHLQWAGGLIEPMDVVRPGRLLARRRPIEPGQEPFRTDWLCGAVFIGRTELLRRIGGFDPRFFLYFEETDLCRRVAEAGYELWAVGGAVADHVVGASSEKEEGGRVYGCIAKHYYPSRYYYLSKHYGLATAAATEMADLARTALRSLKGSARGDGESIRERLKAPAFRMPERAN